MDDLDIVNLYWDRNEQAIKETSSKYSHYCKAIAKNILSSDEDADECVNEAYFKVWNSIPPHRPKNLPAFLGKITRNLSFNKYKSSHAEKRGGGEMALVLEELTDCVSDTDSVERAIDRQELIKAVNSFVRSLSPQNCGIFVRRYWYAETVISIAKEYGLLQGTVSKKLERLRKQLKSYLKERGFEL